MTPKAALEGGGGCQASCPSNIVGYDRAMKTLGHKTAYVGPPVSRPAMFESLLNNICVDAEGQHNFIPSKFFRRCDASGPGVAALFTHLRLNVNTRRLREREQFTYKWPGVCAATAGLLRGTNTGRHS